MAEGFIIFCWCSPFSAKTPPLSCDTEFEHQLIFFFCKNCGFNHCHCPLALLEVKSYWICFYWQNSLFDFYVEAPAHSLAVSRWLLLKKSEVRTIRGYDLNPCSLTFPVHSLKLGSRGVSYSRARTGCFQSSFSMLCQKLHVPPWNIFSAMTLYLPWIKRRVTFLLLLLKQFRIIAAP